MLLYRARNFLDFVGHREVQLGDWRSSEDRSQPELTRIEYLRPLQTMKNLGDVRGYLLVKVFAIMGIFVQELPNAMAENVQTECFPVVHQGVRRMVRLPGCLKKTLLDTAIRQGVASGPIFVGRTRHLLHRSRAALLIEQAMDWQLEQKQLTTGWDV